ncbi:MAG TPA: hypothetical protein VJA85_01625 [Candidatus Limnocylindria bacterium]|nr:hypothetical protein [Candidatus Limnocylindria bacterium]
MGRLLASLVLAFAAGLLPMTTVLACDCEVVEPEAQLARAEVAFVGTVTQVGWEFEGPPPPDLPGAEQPVTFAVEEAIKGTPGSTIQVFSSLDSGMCGIAFAVQQRWQLYAVGGLEGQLTTNNCLGSVLLGEGVIPTPAEEPIRVPTELLVAGGGVALLALVSVLAFRRRPA